jgi:hypothetical protein
MKTKFNLISYFSIPFLIILIGLQIKLVLDYQEIFKGQTVGYFLILFLFLSTILVLMELKNKIIKVEFLENEIKINTFLGLKKSIYINKNTIEGFENSSVYSEYGSYDYIYLKSKDVRIVKISNQYHKNFNEINLEIKNNFKYLGFKASGFRTEFKEFFD